MAAPALQPAAAVAPSQPFARRGVLSCAGVVAVVLVALSSRYGYHRDELYFLACGRHLAWGYPDQPPLVPLLARLMSEVSATSLVVLRLPAALAAAGTVALTGAIARELGAARRAQVLAAAGIGVSNLLLATGHLLSTTTFLLTCTAALVLLMLRLLRTGDPRWWLAIGAVAGLGLLDSDLVAFVVAAFVVGLVVAGPRWLLWTWQALAGGVIAAVLWLPYLVWQAAHGWPQFAVAHAIANGSSGTSAPRWQIIVMQFVLCSPPLVPIWVAGLVRLCRGPSLRWCRALGVAYFALLLAFLVAGGKPYYLAVMFPLLVAAGAAPALEWASRGRAGARRGVLVAAVVVAAVPDAVITLPLVPADKLHATPIVAVDYDVGETVGWPAYTQQIAAAYRTVPRSSDAPPIILAENYGEAGAVDRYGPSLGLPRAYSGHNAYSLWGPPPTATDTVLAVGFRRQTLTRLFASVVPHGVLTNRFDVDNDEQGAELWLCEQPKASWAETWKALRRYG